jgi:hypothetical protein
MNFPSKDQLERVKLLLSIVWSGILVVGGLVIVCYCWTEGFLPDGMSFGDAFTLGYASFSFIAFIAIGLFFGAASALWVVRLMLLVGNVFLRRKGKPASELNGGLKGGFNIIVSVLVTALMIFVAVAYPGPVDLQIRNILTFFSLLGFVGLCFFGAKVPARPPASVKTGVLVLVGLAICAAAGTRPELLNFSLSILGVRSFPSDIVVVDSSAHDKLIEMADVNGLKVQFCQTGPDQWGTFDARTVWNGIGKTSYVRLLDRTTDGSRSILVPVKKEQLEMSRPKNLKLSCKPEHT